MNPDNTVVNPFNPIVTPEATAAWKLAHPDSRIPTIITLLAHVRTVLKQGKHPVDSMEQTERASLAADLQWCIEQLSKGGI